MATISETIENISMKVLSLFNRIEVLEKKNLKSLDRIELKYLKDELETKTNLLFVVLDNRTKYSNVFVKDELKKTILFYKSFNKRISNLENKIKL